MMKGPSALVPQQKQKQMAEHGEAWTNSHDRRSMVEHDRRSLIMIRRDKKDWISPETGVPYAGFDMGDKNLITMKIYSKSKIV